VKNLFIFNVGMRGKNIPILVLLYMFSMQKILTIFSLLILFSSCFRTSMESKEEILKAQIRDSLRVDSINKRRNIPDTAIVSFQRANICDDKLMVVFDRVKVLSGKEAAEYSLRHKRFGNNLNVVINKEVTLETLAMDEKAPVYVFKKNLDPNTPAEEAYDYVEKEYDIIRNKDVFAVNQVIEIIILHRSIIYAKQKELE